MGAIQLSAEMQRMVEDAIAKGLAESADALVERALLSYLDDPDDEQGIELTDEGWAIVEAGLADADAGRYIEINTREELKRWGDTTMAEVVACAAEDE